MLAGISVEYYTQLERGNVKGVSEDVLEAVIRALQLDEIERTHLFDLTRAAKQLPTRQRATPVQVRPAVQRVLDTITDGAAFIRNPRADFLTGNRLAYALYADAFTTLDRPVSLPRFVFLDPRARIFYRDGTASPRRPSAACAPKPPAIPTTATSPSSSVSCRCAATTSDGCGPPTTSPNTAAASSTSTTNSSATST